MDEKHRCVQLSVNPSRGLVDEQFVILVQNTLPCFQLTIRSFHQCDDGHGWDAFAHYVSDAIGNVDVSKDCSLGGTYCGVEPMGLLWSLRPLPGSNPGLRMRKKNVEMPMVVTVSVYQGHRNEGFADQVPLASVVVERWYMAPGVRRIPVTEGGLTAALFLPPGPGPFPAVLDLWGGGGQLVEYRAALLASHGIAALALDYLTAKVIKETRKPGRFTYIESAYKFLQEHPDILGSRIAMLGLSFGASVTFRMAAHSEVVKLRCVVCISGSHMQQLYLDMKDILISFFRQDEKARLSEENHVIMRDMSLPIPTDPLEKVDVGLLQCPMMLIIGEDDQNLATREAADDMKEMMERAGNSHLLTVLSYPGAGHLIEPPYTPHVRSSKFKMVNSNDITILLWGGETVAHSRAQEDSWKKMLVFLKEALNGGSRPGMIPFSNL